MVSSAIMIIVGEVVCVVLIILLIIRINKSGVATPAQATNSKRFGIKALVEITDDQYYGSGLYYDKNTMNVYYWNGHVYDTCATMPTACYASNGLQYRYNPDAHMLIEPDIS